jgi:hypothetical protein
MIKYNKEIQSGYAGMLGEVISVAIEDYVKYKGQVRSGEGDFTFNTAKHFLFGKKHKETFNSQGGSIMLSLEMFLAQCGWGDKLNMGQVRLLAESKVRDRKQEWSTHLTKGEDYEEDDRSDSLFVANNGTSELGE